MDVMLHSMLVVMLQALKKSNGFPVAAVAFSTDGKKLAVAINAKGQTKTNHHTHAEHILINDKNLQSHDGEICLMISLPPCCFCLEEIKSQYGDRVKIFFLFDIWGKSKKQYILNSGIKIEWISQSSGEKDEMRKLILERINSPSHRSSKKRLKRLNYPNLFFRY